MAGLDVSLRGAENDPTAAVAELVGVIDGTTVVKFQDSLEEITKKGVRRLILDMAKVRYVNSTGLGSLVKYADKFKSAGGGMALMKVTAKVKIVIEMLGLQAFFEICADERQALEALTRRAGAPAPAAPPPASAAPAHEPVDRSSSTASAGDRVPAYRPAHPEPHRPAEPPPTPQPRPSARHGAMTSPAQPVAETAQTAGFPQVVACQSCGVGIEVPQPGNWKCPRCLTLLSVRPDGGARFLVPDKPQPFELSLNCTREGQEALKQFVGVVAQPLLAPQALDALKAAVGEVAQVIATAAYGQDPKAVYHVSVETTPSEVRIRLADHGKTLDSTRMEAYFPQATRNMSEFECRPHPKGGNVIRMVRKR